MKNTENAAMPMSGRRYVVFNPRRLSGNWSKQLRNEASRASSTRTMKDSQGSGYRILCPRACARCPAGFIAKLFGPVSRQASWIEHHLSPARHRHGGVFGVFHAEPVVPRSSAAVRGGPRAIQLRESVRHTENPERQSHS